MSVISLPNVDLLDLEPWESDALCAIEDPAIFYLDLGASAGPAKAVCALCPVRSECLDFALRNMDSVESPGYWGIWAGTTERERRAMLRALKRAPELEAAA